MIKKYIKEVCEILNIKEPAISYDASHFPTPTTWAVCNSDTIFLKKVTEPNPDYLFAIAHELRHIWQIQTDPDYFLANYKDSTKLSKESYNLQPAEVDANAFASIIMNDFFCLQPQWHGLPDTVISAIESQINNILLSF